MFNIIQSNDQSIPIDFQSRVKFWQEKWSDYSIKQVSPSMQDILDAWLRCQESWLYLEPIFNSEDIMKQMPVNIFSA